MANSGRFNRDTGETEGLGISVLFGSGDGTFREGMIFGAGNFPASAAVGDFNRDGSQDLAVANLPGDVSVLLGNGDGTFQKEMIYRGMGLDFRLVTASGEWDLLLSDRGRRGVSRD